MVWPRNCFNTSSAFSNSILIGPERKKSVVNAFPLIGPPFLGEKIENTSVVEMASEPGTV